MVAHLLRLCERRRGHRRCSRCGGASTAAAEPGDVGDRLPHRKTSKGIALFSAREAEVAEHAKHVQTRVDAGSQPVCVDGIVKDVRGIESNCEQDSRKM
jgi:hypothetical protein